jgi:hypothetical protein
VQPAPAITTPNRVRYRHHTPSWKPAPWSSSPSKTIKYATLTIPLSPFYIFKSLLRFWKKAKFGQPLTRFAAHILLPLSSSLQAPRSSPCKPAEAAKPGPPTPLLHFRHPDNRPPSLPHSYSTFVQAHHATFGASRSVFRPTLSGATPTHQLQTIITFL